MMITVAGGDRFTALSRRVRAFAARLPVLGDAMLRAATITIEQRTTTALRQEAPVGPDRTNPDGTVTPGGGLRDSLAAAVRIVGGQVTVSFTGADYARYVIGGTAPHTITPVRASVLAFDVGGTMVFARAVQHPGTQPNPFQARAYAAALPDIQAAIRRAGRDLLVSFR